MKTGFNQNQFDKDVEAVRTLLVGFLKSMGPKQKKIGEQPIGFLEEQHIRFRLNMVEWGISKIIRACIVIIVGILVFVPIFFAADGFFKVVSGLVFLAFLAWMMLDHLKASAKDGSRIAGLLVTYNTHRETAQGATTGALQNILGIIPQAFQKIGDFLTKKSS